ncbi:MAG: hypothetical protein NWR72_09955 [Bacteroidia bacterium]|nr:hypothetical protein [Bacteroidia bacterium]
MSQHLFFANACPKCGKQLLYGAGKKELTCKGCGYKRILQNDSDQILERKLTAGVSFDGFARGMGDQVSACACETCKATLAVHDNHKLQRCPICAASPLKPIEVPTDALEPKELLPFTLPRHRARSILRKYLRKRRWWLLPPAIFQMLRDDRLQQLYIPAYLLEAYVRASWKAKAGYRIPVAGKGQIEEREVWEPVSGYWENLFENQFQFVSPKVDSKLFALINDYSFGELVNYDPRYLDAFPAEIATKDPKASLGEFEKSLDELIKATATQKIKGEKVNELKVISDKEALTFRHVLLPVWMSSFSYFGKTYQFLINGRSGKIAGDKPLSPYRIGLLLALIIATLVALVLWRR